MWHVAGSGLQCFKLEFRTSDLLNTWVEETLLCDIAEPVTGTADWPPHHSHSTTITSEMQSKAEKTARDAHIRWPHLRSDIVLHLVPWPRVLNSEITTEKYTIFSAVQSLFLLYCYTRSYHSFIKKGFSIDFIATNIIKIINANCIITVCIKWLCAIIWHTKNSYFYWLS